MVFVDLFRKTEQVKRQAVEQIALAEERSRDGEKALIASGDRPNVTLFAKRPSAAESRSDSATFGCSDFFAAAISAIISASSRPAG